MHHRTFDTLAEVMEAAARAASDDDSRTQLPCDTGEMLQRLLDGAAGRKHRSGVVVERPGESVYMPVIGWDGHSTMPARRTMERLLREFEDSGCQRMVLVTDAPRSFCEIPKGPEGDAPLIIPAEGLQPLLDGLETLETR